MRTFLNWLRTDTRFQPIQVAVNFKIRGQVQKIHGYGSELASGWDFFGVPNPDPGNLGSGFFYFGLDRIISKIPKSGNPENPKIPGIRIGILKPLKNSSAKSEKSWNPGDRDLKSPKKSRKNPEWKIPNISKIPGFFYLGTFIKNIKEIFGRKFAYLAEHLKTQFEYTQLPWSTNLLSHIIRFRISLNKVNLFPRFDFSSFIQFR